MDDLVQILRLAFEEILEEATGDKDWDIVTTAASGALDAIEEFYDDELPF